jgi:hypothetical protein
MKRIAGLMVEVRAGSEFNRFWPLPEQRQRICDQF